MPPHDRSHSLGLEKLKSSGLDAKDGKLLGMEFLSPSQTARLHTSFKAVSSLKIPYYGLDGLPLPDAPAAKGFFRLRYLEQPKAEGFDAVAERKEVRYVQLPNTLPVAYYPRSVDWASIARDADAPLIVTEGELKAAKACREGFPTLGLGGVWNWRSLKAGVPWIESLDLVAWARRNVYVCFDSDMRKKPDVCIALQRLSEQLVRRGAMVHAVSLPQAGTQKVGLDDFLVAAGRDGPARLRQLLSEAEPIGIAAPLWSLNDRYVYVKDPGVVVRRSTYAKVPAGAFREHVESTHEYLERSVKKDGTLSYEATSASAAWLKWPLRAEAERMTYRPGQPQLSDGELNIWPGWGVEPRAGDVSPFLRLVDHLFTGAEPEAKRWFLRWCAHPLQFPGTKLFTSVVFHGVRHGTGKSFVGYTLGRIYGKNFTEISQQDLHNHFNEWAEGKQLVMGDDVTGSDKRQDADVLKKLITQKELRVNGKYVPTYVVPDCVNYFFTSQHPDSFFLEDDDRRFFVHEVTVGPLPEEFYVEYDLWLDSGGSQAVFRYLLDLDLADFNPAAPALRTAARERMIATVQSDLGGWVRTLLRDPEQVLRVGEVPIAKDVFTSKELLDLYDPAGRTGTTANGLGRELSRAGARQVCAGRPVLACGSQSRYYAVRNAERWLAASPAAVAKHVEDWVRSSEPDVPRRRSAGY